MMTASARPSVKAGKGVLTVTDDRIFRSGSEVPARRFARRVLHFGEVSSLALDPGRTSVTLSYRAADGDAGALLGRLADAVAGSGIELDDAELPQLPVDEPVTLHRHGDIVSTFEELNIANGYLTARHSAVKHNNAVARRVENAMRVVPGVIQATATGELRVRFDPRAVPALRLIRMAEAQILGRATIHSAPSPEPVSFRLENVTLGVAAVGEFVLPLMAPAASALLVVGALNTFGTAVSQLRERKIDLPMLYTCAVGARLFSGQFLAAALLSWFFRYWEHRYRRDSEVENRILLEETATLPRQARVLTANGLVRLVPRREVFIGQRVRALAGETVPVDAIVRCGAALVDQTVLCGTSPPSRKVPGDEVFAGSVVLAGGLDLEVLRIGDETRAARIAQNLIEATVPPPHAPGLNREADDFAGHTVVPTLLTAVGGLAVDGLTTAGAVLSPDYATGIGLAVPLERLRDVKLAVHHGTVIRAGDALGRFATTSWIVLDDHEALHDEGCDVAEMCTKRLDKTRLLPAMAAAGIWLGDERGPALARACRERGLIVRRAELSEIDGTSVTIGYGDHVVRLRGRPVIAGVAPPPLIVEVDGVEEAGVRFRRDGRLEAAVAVHQLQQDGLYVFLASERTAEEAALFARQLGVDLHCGNMSLERKIWLLRELRRRRVAAAYIGECPMETRVAQAAHLSIGLAGVDLPAGTASRQVPVDIAILGLSIASLPALRILAHDSARRIARTQYSVMAPNLMSVAGAFVFELTAMAVVVVSNFATSMAYEYARRSLHKAANR